jgi:molybdopterin-guanine dinucleotide biosynthesis protein A
VTEPGRAEQRPDLGGVVLSGGAAVRLEGADKASMEVGGATLLEHVVGALAEVPEVVVVGPEVATSRRLTFLREDPPGGGPAAGLLAGLHGFARAPRHVVVLAVDLPLVTTATVRRLLHAAEEDGAMLVDEGGRRQYLCAVYRTDALLAAAPPYGEPSGLSMRALVAGLILGEVPALAGEARDVDTWQDLREVRERLGG